MAEAAVRFPTFEELYDGIAALRAGLTGEILEPGLIRVMPRPAAPHRHAAKQVGRALDGKDAAVGGRGWWIENEAEVRLGDKLVVPDLLGYRVERVPTRPTENLLVAPDWVCEVLSPSNGDEDRRLKLPIYAAAGIPHIWFVDPEARTVELFVPSRGRASLVTTARDTDRVRLAPFDDVELDVATWWSSHEP